MSQNDRQTLDHMEERLSAAIDNELTSSDCQELVDELFKTPEMQRAWERQHTVNALLRGEEIEAVKSINWQQLHGQYASMELPRKAKAQIFDIKVLRDQFSIKVMGGMALAASLVLAVSMVLVINQSPATSIQPGIADTMPSSQLSPQLVRSNSAASPTNNVTNLPNTRTNNPQPEFLLASDQELAPAVENESRSERSRAALPAEPAKRDLVRLVSDKP